MWLFASKEGVSYYELLYSPEKKLASDKHSSLFCLIVSDIKEQFHNFLWENKQKYVFSGKCSICAWNWETTNKMLHAGIKALLETVK